MLRNRFLLPKEKSEKEIKDGVMIMIKKRNHYRSQHFFLGVVQYGMILSKANDFYAYHLIYWDFPGNT